MDTGFNYYFGADPSEYDLVVSNSEGGLDAAARDRRAPRGGGLLGRRPRALPPHAVDKETDVFFYGYGDKFRQEWMEAMIGEPSRRPDVDFALGGRDFRATSAARGLVGDVPFNVFSRAISAARINLNVTRHSTRPCYASSTCRPFELACPARRSCRTRTTGSTAGSSRAGSCSSSRTRRRPRPPTRSCSTTRAVRRRWAAPPASAARRAHVPPSRTAAARPAGRGGRWPEASAVR